MGLEFGRATTAAEIEAVQRLRYAVYVEEMNRYRGVAGEDEGRFAEPEDEHSWIYYARDGADVVAATRMTWGPTGSPSARSTSTSSLHSLPSSRAR